MWKATLREVQVMNRRQLLTRLLTAAAALPLLGARASEAQASEVDPFRVQAEKVMANPERYPDEIARARELMGLPSQPFNPAEPRVVRNGVGDYTLTGNVQPGRVYTLKYEQAGG